MSKTTEEMSEVTTSAAEVVIAFTTEDRYFRMALVTMPMYTRLRVTRREGANQTLVRIA